MSSHSNRSFSGNRSFNQPLTDRNLNRNANRVRPNTNRLNPNTHRFNRNDRWDRWGRWNRRPYYNRYPYYNYNYNPYYYPILDTTFSSPLSSYAPVRWFYKYPYYYYFYGYPYNRWYRVYQPIQGAPFYTPPLANNLVAVDAADQSVVADDATVYAVPEGFDTVTNTDGAFIQPEIGTIQDYELKDYIAYDTLMKSNNSTYFMCGIFLLMIILLLIVLFS